MAGDARVLIVESQDTLRVVLFAVLRHQSLAVDTAATAAAALERIATCDYALILLDLNLPDGESVEFLRSFRETRPDATTFVLAVRDPGQDVDLGTTKVNAILNKPLEIDTLAEVVRECALVVPPPPEPLGHCPPAESEIKEQMDHSGSMLTN
jgi:two-component system OmpR family response regulator